MLKTGTRPVFKKGIGAVPDLKQFLNELQRFPEIGHRGIRAEIMAPVFDDPPGYKQPGKTMGGEAKARVRLVIAEHNLVPRPVRLDQAVFEEKCFFLAVGKEPLHRHNLRNQNLDGWSLIPTGNDIRLEEIPKVFRLPDVKNRLGVPFEKVDAGCLRRPLDLFDGNFVHGRNVSRRPDRTEFLR